MKPFGQTSGSGIESCVVRDDAVGGPPLIVQRQLAGLSPSKFVFVPGTLLANTSQPGLERDLDKDHRITQIIPASFQHHGGIENDELNVRTCLTDLLFELSPDFRMNDSFELSEGIGVL